MEQPNQLNQNNPNPGQQIHIVPPEPRKPLDRLDLLSALGDAVTVTGAAIGYFERVGGPVMSFAGILTTQISNYYTNKKNRDSNEVLENTLDEAKREHTDINVQLPNLNKRDKFGLKVKGWSSTSTILTSLVAGSSTVLAVIYNGFKFTTGEEYEPVLIASIGASLLAPVAEKILQHFKTDNLNRQAKVYERALRFFPAAAPNVPEENIVQPNPANAPGI